MSVYKGERLTIELYGRSHEEFIGGRLSGIPAGHPIDTDALRRFMERRAAGQYIGSTARREPDEVDIISGITDGVTDGSTIELRIRNRDARPSDYDELKYTPRPGHADLGAWLKYGGAEDMRGGGAFSGRMTAPLCAVGNIAIQLLAKQGVNIISHIRKIGGVEDERFDMANIPRETPDGFPTLSEDAGKRMLCAIEQAARERDSLGGIVECAVTGFPPGVGGTTFDGLEGRLSALLFAVPAVKGVEFGAGFEAAALRGSENNDAIILRDGVLMTETNNAGGILGGISTGMPLVFSVAFKPTPTIGKRQRTVRLDTMTPCEIELTGRHDACFVPRALPAVEAAAALALLDILEANDGR